MYIHRRRPESRGGPNHHRGNTSFHTKNEKQQIARTWRHTGWVFKLLGNGGLELVSDILNNCWEKEIMPDEMELAKLSYYTKRKIWKTLQTTDQYRFWTPYTSYMPLFCKNAWQLDSTTKSSKHNTVSGKREAQHSTAQHSHYSLHEDSKTRQKQQGINCSSSS